ncbi:MAG: hypothetical protein NTW96_06545 [Planctomycetia bacterium]|nr:hypothetical protein [Planctomycetia bacterium]
MAADYACLTIDPTNPDGPRIEVVFPAAYTTRLFKYAPVDFENLRSAKYVLENTQRIFFGVRAFNEGGWCFSGRPREWFLKERIVVPFPHDKVFVVYINPRMQVYECRAEFIAEDDPLAPIDWQTRFRGLTWKSIF